MDGRFKCGAKNLKYLEEKIGKSFYKLSSKEGLLIQPKSTNHNRKD